MNESTSTADSAESALDDCRITVLLIEDDEAIADMYTMRLVSDGYRVIEARDGTTGLSMARAAHPDLVYLDLRLPGLDGFEVLERLRADDATAAIPVIILTNLDEPALRARGLRLGVLEFLVKTAVAPAQLAQTTDRWTRLKGPTPPVTAWR